MSSSIKPSGSVDIGVAAREPCFEEDGLQRLKRPPRLGTVFEREGELTGPLDDCVISRNEGWRLGTGVEEGVAYLSTPSGNAVL
jgi:hypothetical protein